MAHQSEIELTPVLRHKLTSMDCTPDYQLLLPALTSILQFVESHIYSRVERHL